MIELITTSKPARWVLSGMVLAGIAEGLLRKDRSEPVDGPRGFFKGALKAAELRWAKEQGYELLRTQNEERNTPIRRLNKRFGYRAAPGRILLRGPVAAG